MASSDHDERGVSGGSAAGVAAGSELVAAWRARAQHMAEDARELAAFSARVLPGPEATALGLVCGALACAVRSLRLAADGIEELATAKREPAPSAPSDPTAN